MSCSWFCPLKFCLPLHTCQLLATSCLPRRELRDVPRGPSNRGQFKVGIDPCWHRTGMQASLDDAGRFGLSAVFLGSVNSCSHLLHKRVNVLLERDGVLLVVTGNFRLSGMRLLCLITLLWREGEYYWAPVSNMMIFGAFGKRSRSLSRISLT